ncbi:hypothetical protein IV63_GL001732 [Companilactobacillus crustorum]|uniref:Uncharacterized protein n=2 Tax=Companilactobacillus crustorum TaxID=392416 RepID=A0A837RIX6_9LACO|nr:hypothetical protein BI355_1621 [Companilactobacillus crustorum]KRK42667.1 hypothetical protein FD26_GL000406 [Companilactobacillus crustorum JCM 15951]KRO21273.1 hypothetical protein IV63_GL001732 [Companilactobacillus crustorum]
MLGVLELGILVVALVVVEVVGGVSTVAGVLAVVLGTPGGLFSVDIDEETVAA